MGKKKRIREIERALDEARLAIIKLQRDMYEINLLDHDDIEAQILSLMSQLLLQESASGGPEYGLQPVLSNGNPEFFQFADHSGPIGLAIHERMLDKIGLLKTSEENLIAQASRPRSRGFFFAHPPTHPLEP
jgi:hypothetical protein